MGNLPSITAACAGDSVRTKYTLRKQNKDIQCAASGMQGFRPTMEDQHLIHLGDDDDDNDWLEDHNLFGVFDGHAGSSTSEFLAQNFCDTLKQTAEMKKYTALKAKGPKSRSDVNGVQLLMEALTVTFHQLDDELRQFLQKNKEKLTDTPESDASIDDDDSGTSSAQHQDRSGSTAVVVLLSPTHIICANCGDSRAILRRYGRILPLSFDHKPSHVPEKLRITAAGGMVKGKRIDGDLAVSRAFGDFSLKKNRSKLIVTPDIVVYPRDREGDEFMILACDGVWDVATSEQCSEFVQALLSEGELDFGNICEEALDTCLERKSRDNMTIVMVGFLQGIKADSSGRARLNNALWGHRTSRRARELTNAAIDHTAAAYYMIDHELSSLCNEKMLVSI